MKKAVLFVLSFLLIQFSYSQRAGDKTDPNVRLIRDFISDISAPGFNFSLGVMNRYFDEYEEFEGDMAAYYLSSRFGIDRESIDAILKNNFSKGADTIPSIAILFLRNKNLPCLTCRDQSSIDISLYEKNEKAVGEGMNYRRLSYKVAAAGCKDEYLIFEMNPYPDEKCRIIDIKDRNRNSVFN